MGSRGESSALEAEEGFLSTQRKRHVANLRQLGESDLHRTVRRYNQHLHRVLASLDLELHEWSQCAKEGTVPGVKASMDRYGFRLSTLPHIHTSVAGNPTLSTTGAQIHKYTCTNQETARRNAQRKGLTGGVLDEIYNFEKSDGHGGKRRRKRRHRKDASAVDIIPVTTRPRQQHHQKATNNDDNEDDVSSRLKPTNQRGARAASDDDVIDRVTLANQRGPKRRRTLQHNPKHATRSEGDARARRDAHMQSTIPRLPSIPQRR